MDPIKADEVDEYLPSEVRRLGYVYHSLIGNWDDWVKRRVEQIELVSDASAKRRISVDFRLDSDVFVEAVIDEGEATTPRKMHYVPLTLLKKAPFANFDLRDESGTALPLLTRRKTATIGAATLAAAARWMVVEQLLKHGANPELTETLASSEIDFDLETLQIPKQIEADFINLCAFPYTRRVDDDDERTAKEIRDDMLKATVGKTPIPVRDWKWERDSKGKWHAKDIDYPTWILGIFQDHILNSLIFDLTRLYIVAAPVEAEPGRRRIIKLEYEEHLREPGLKLVAGLRRRISKSAGRIRAREDCLEGLDSDLGVARREWTPPRSGMSTTEVSSAPGGQGPHEKVELQTLWEAILMGIGWLVKPITFPLPSVGLGGTFHLEVIAPAGTQLRRAQLRALDRKSAGDDVEPRDEKAHRYARNVTRAHLYLGGDRQGTWGDASMSIKPKSSTVIRGAALASCVVLLLVVFASFLSGSLGDESQTAIAILLLAPGIIAAVAGQPFEHSVTSKMVFGLRLIALTVASVAVTSAALLSAHFSFCDQPVAWSLVLILALVLTVILLGAWRLAGRDWPRRL